MSRRQVTVADPGAEPILLGAATLAGRDAGGLAVAQNGCAGQILEPHETCVVAVRFRPAAGGEAVGALELASDQGPLDVPVSATAPSLSALSSPELPAKFTPIKAGDGIGYPQRWIPVLTNPLSAAVTIGSASLSGPGARRFRIRSDSCAHATLRPQRSCRLTVLFTPTRAGIAQAQLTLRGTGVPLTAALRPVAFPLPTVTRLVPAGTGGCAISAGDPIVAATSQPAIVLWTLARAPASERRGCGPAAAPGGARVAAGGAMTGHRRGRVAGAPGYRAQWRLGRAGGPGLAASRALRADRVG